MSEYVNSVSFQGQLKNSGMVIPEISVTSGKCVAAWSGLSNTSGDNVRGVQNNAEMMNSNGKLKKLKRKT
jgi:hypothetical protein